MAYEVYIDDMLLPIPPQKIPIKYPGQNETATLINGEEINITRPPGLAEISVDVVLPQMDYPCAMWDGSVEDAEEFISRLQDLKESGDAFEFIIIRDSFDTNMDVTLEDYKVSDDDEGGPGFGGIRHHEGSQALWNENYEFYYYRRSGNSNG